MTMMTLVMMALMKMKMTTKITLRMIHQMEPFQDFFLQLVATAAPVQPTKHPDNVGGDDHDIGDDDDVDDDGDDLVAFEEKVHLPCDIPVIQSNVSQIYFTAEILGKHALCKTRRKGRGGCTCLN